MKVKGLKILLVLVVIVLVHNSIYSQKADSLCYFSGQVVSSQGNYPVAFAHVINLEQKRGVVADTSGFFHIWVKQGDTLNISAIGFDYFEYRVGKINRDSIVEIRIQSRYYEIPEVSISYLGTYKQFEYKVLNLELPKLELNSQVEALFKYDVVFTPYVEPTITSPASLVYSLFSKEAKAIKKYIAIKEKEGETNELQERYNEHIIRNLTGLEGDEIGEFIKFCDFKDVYILSVSDYKLYSEILVKFEEFKKSKKDIEKSE